VILSGRGNPLRRLIFGALLASGTIVSANAQQCPIGSYPWVDSWGNEICKGFGTGQTTTIQGDLENCPVGTHPWVDNWGNQVCQSFNGGTQYYDTSQGCPVGTYQWVDNWGNQVCRRF
jgi:hypothetical protein